MTELAAAQTRQRIPTAPAASGALQRKCACGQHTGTGGECAECKRKRLGLQRQAISAYGPATAPPIVHDVRRAPGQPLDVETRASLEPHFGYDFSRVRVHTDAPQSLQASLTVNQPGDEYEQEADQVAEQVMRMPEPHADIEERASHPKLVVRRRIAESGGGRTEAPPIVHDVLRSTGQPLDAATRAFMEPRFGHDFGQVSVHADAHAADSARAVDAYAYTVGQHVVFGADRYAPTTFEGRRLLAHELTHVVQQAGNMQLPYGDYSRVGEAEAHNPHAAHTMAERGFAERVLEQSGGHRRQYLQRQNPLPTGGSSAPPATSGGGPATSAAGAPSPLSVECPNYYAKLGPPARQGPKQLRLTDCSCVWQGGMSGGPTATPLTPAQQQQLQDFIGQLQRDIPDLYAAVHGGDVQVTHADLQPGNLGQMQGEGAVCAMEADVWTVFDMAGGDFAQGILPSQAEYHKAELAVANHPARLVGLGNIQTRTRYVGVIKIDLNQAGPKTQSAFDTLKHEAGHFLFEAKFVAGRDTSPQLPASLKTAAAARLGEQVQTELDLITEFAAESVEALSAGATFDPGLFSGELDPTFGISGFRDEQGNTLTPKPWGWRMLEKLSLLDAKKKAQEWKEKGVGPIALQTDFSLNEERRFFHLWLGQFDNPQEAQAWFDTILKPLGINPISDVAPRQYSSTVVVWP